MSLKELVQAIKEKGVVLTLEGSDENPTKTLSFVDEKWVIVRLQLSRTEEEVVRDVALAEIRTRIARQRAARRTAKRKGR